MMACVMNLKFNAFTIMCVSGFAYIQYAYRPGPVRGQMAFETKKSLAQHCIFTFKDWRKMRRHVYHH